MNANYAEASRLNTSKALSVCVARFIDTFSLHGQAIVRRAVRNAIIQSQSRRRGNG